MISCSILNFQAFDPSEITFTLYRWLDREVTQVLGTYRGATVARFLHMTPDDIDFPLARRRAEQEMVAALRYLAGHESNYTAEDAEGPREDEQPASAAHRA